MITNPTTNTMKIITSKGFWVSSSFTEKFGSKDIKPAKTVPAFRTFERNMYDKEIKSELGAQECTLEDVAAFLKNPPEGTDDGNWNIFYVAGCVVRVYWRSDYREWYVYAWLLGDDYWDAGSRAFGVTAPQNLSPDVALSPSETESLGLPTNFTERLEALEAIVKYHNLTCPTVS